MDACDAGTVVDEDAETTSLAGDGLLVGHAVLKVPDARVTTGDSSSHAREVEKFERLEDALLIDLTGEVPVLSLGAVSFTLDGEEPSRRSRVAVRALDLVIAVPAVILCLPVLAALAVLVGLTSEGPVFYRSARQTRHGEAFGMLKFRTMVVDADEVLAQYLHDDPTARELFERNHKLQRDPRVTRVGRWMRSLSFDELPQLLNVICGEMSIVGPRPLLDWEAPRFGSALPTVQRVKGGITGLWQVSGRSDVQFQERVVLDVDYALRRDLRQDLKILAKTASQVLRGSPGAY